MRTTRRLEKLTNVMGEMRRARLDILGLSDIRWKEAGDFVSEGVRVISPPPHRRKGKQKWGRDPIF